MSKYTDDSRRRFGLREPLEVNEQETAVSRWLAKHVHRSRLLDDMESKEHWVHEGFGEVSLTDERCIDGQLSLRLTSPTIADRPGPVPGRPFGSARVTRRFTGENWQEYNRLSFWVYPKLPGFNVISLLVLLHNEGSKKVPDEYGREGLNYVILKPDQWNQVVWEIDHLSRDKVTGVSFEYRLQGNEPGATDEVCFDFDHLELQEVDPDHYEGWDVWPGRIAFSHTGYHTHGKKTALASDLKADRFRLLCLDDGRVIFTGPVKKTGTPLGDFQVLDFSDVTQEGTYVLQAGDVTTRPFRISKRVWEETIWKTINFFYCQRCGVEVPEIHGVCHRDWRCAHGDKSIIINGGWHDAGDLSQGLVNTAEAVRAMFSLAERVKTERPELYARLMEEASWGLEWVLKTRFGDGHRSVWATMDFWTDGIIGTVDDVVAPAANDPFSNFVAAAAEALAARLLASEDAHKAGCSLQAAQGDFAAGMAALGDNPHLEVVAAGANAAIELYKTTGDGAFAEKVVRMAETILACQETRVQKWTIPLAGFFYTTPKKEKILHYAHRGHEQAPITALAELCHLLPGHPDWIKWYSGVLRHSEYLRRAASLTAPYGMLPSSIYRLDESERKTYNEQVRNGVRLDDLHYLRRFPVWYDFRGNHGTVLSQTKALAVAAHLRGDIGLADLCQQQLQWVVGRNPFCQSTMYGEGYDYAPQYTAMSGDMVGSLPVGIQTRENADVPYWPPANCYNYKEVWVHPSSRWLWLMCDLEGEAFLEVAREGSGKSPRITLGYKNVTADRISIELAAQGEGRVSLDLRSENLQVDAPHRELQLVGEQPVSCSWEARIIDSERPWVAVVVLGDDLDCRQEVFGWPEPV